MDSHTAFPAVAIGASRLQVSGVFAAVGAGHNMIACSCVIPIAAKDHCAAAIATAPLLFIKQLG